MSFQLADQVHQVLTPAGEVVGEAPDLPAERLMSLYRWMVLGRVFSDRMIALQRQGRMGTFAPLNGQEATAVGTVVPLEPKDWLMGSYRDILSEMVKGVPPLAIMERYGGRVTTEYHREIHCIPFQVVLATQMLHAAGIAMAIKYEQAPQVVMGICGDGATSQGDFNEALNFAGVFKAPVIFMVQNNGWAISVPRRQQTATEYIAHRGPGFGMPGYVVDGNDLLAVYQVVADCVARARAGYGPSLVEALTYRLGAHTTADDPKKYRSEAELQEWTPRDPLIRYRKFLLDRYILSEADDKCLYEEVRAQIQKTIESYEALPPPDPDQLFDLVYAEPTPQLQRQRLALRQYLENGGSRIEDRGSRRVEGG